MAADIRESMTYLSLFSGVGGLDRAIPGECVVHVEWDAYAQRVLRRHWPTVPVLGDVRDVRGEDYRGVDWVIGGPPCQAASHAGLQLGEADPRWMWPEAVRIVRETQAGGFFFENVTGLMTLNGGRSFGAILSALTALGYFCRWDHCTAAEVGRPHLRDRVWIVGTRREPKPRGWMSVPIPQVKRWPRAGWASEGRAGEDAARWPKRGAWPLVSPGVCPPSGIWPTPSGGTFNDAENVHEWAARRERVKEAIGNGNGFGMPLGIAARLWPTPKASDEGDRGLSVERREAGVVDGLRVAAKLWPTPAYGDSKGAANLTANRNPANLGSRGGSGNPASAGVTLTDAIRMWPTSSASDSEMVKQYSGGSPSLATAAGQWVDGRLVAGRLNPAWVESLLMGWPLGWTDPDGDSLADAPPPPRDVEVAPRLTVAKANRRDRLRCTGNGVVTETAALVFSTLVAETAGEGG